jgi:hypothetical protein
VCDISNLIKIILSLAPLVWYVTACDSVGPKTLENFIIHVTFLLGYFHETTGQKTSCNIFTVLFSGDQPSSKDFDITLMICLLRNLMPIDIMDNRLPSATDTSLRADLSRIKFYRNMIVHCNSALVDDTDFESYWNDVTPVMHNNFTSV